MEENQSCCEKVLKKWTYQQNEEQNGNVIGVKVNDLIVTEKKFSYRSELTSKEGQTEKRDFLRVDLALSDIKSVYASCSTIAKSFNLAWLFFIVAGILAIVSIFGMATGFNFGQILLLLFAGGLVALGIFFLKRPKKKCEVKFFVTFVTRTKDEDALTVGGSNMTIFNKTDSSLVLEIPEEMAFEIADTIGTLCIK
ncbi:MAG: DUF308 domain-containing protein [Clostridia bacterium]|nr:DUF308 domain-containing protein [Clostridia bacterium]